MRTATLKIKELLENTNYSLIETGESKSSNYWFLWDNSNGKFPENGIKEDDAIKLRVSNHDAICGRSMTRYEVVYNFHHQKDYQVTINTGCWLDTNEEAFSELNDMFDFDFSKTEIEEIEGCQVTLKINETKHFEELCANILIKKLLN